MDTVAALVTAVRTGLAESADAELAEPMRAYMKSEMPYYGVPNPVRVTLTKHAFAEFPLPDKASWLDAVLTLWREATFREERYCAIALAAHKPYTRWREPDVLPVHEELIVSGAWWDYVDELAIRHVGPLLADHRADITPIMHTWAVDTDLWKRRTSIICQIKAKTDTDLALLAAAIQANAQERDFFIRKGIGWALREYGKTDPAWVSGFVTEHPELSPLSRREATRRLDPDVPAAREGQ
jgi:3-methyladenine DNA glycosylase AlkD